MSKFQKLDAWKISIELVNEIYLLSRKYRQEKIGDLTSQSKWTEVSIPSDITKGIRKHFKKDPIQFLYKSKDSLYELDTLLNFAGMLGNITDEAFIKILLPVDQNMHVLNGLIKYVKRADLK